MPSLFTFFSAQTVLLDTSHGRRAWIVITADDMTTIEAIAIYSFLDKHFFVVFVLYAGFTTNIDVILH